MARRILVVPCGPDADSTAVCLGLVHALSEQGTGVSYVKPLAQPTVRGEDPSAEVFRMVTNLRPPQPMSAARSRSLLAVGDVETLGAEIVAMSAEEVEAHEIVVFEGLRPGTATFLTDQVNREIAAALDADVLLVASAGDLSTEVLGEQVAALARPLTGRDGDRVVGVVVDRFTPESATCEEYTSALAAHGLRAVACLADQDRTARPRVADLVRELGLEVLNEGDQARRVGSIVIAAQSAPGFIELFDEGALIVVPGDRAEVLMAAALAETGGTRLAGLLLTVGTSPAPSVLELVRPALQAGLPLLLSSERTFPIVQAVLALDSRIPSDDEDRARGVMVATAEALDADWVRELAAGGRVPRLTAARARADAVRLLGVGHHDIALAAGSDPVALAAASAYADFGGVRCHLVADPAAVGATARDLGFDIPPGLRIVDPAHPGQGLLGHVMAARGCDEAAAREALRDPLVCAYALAATGEVDGVVGGDLDDPATLALADEIVGGRTDIASTVTALMSRDDASLWADIALNDDPSAEDLAVIGIRAAENSRSVGLAPRVVFVSPSRFAHDRAELVARSERAMEIVRDRRPDLHVVGVHDFGVASSRTAGGDGDDAGGASVYVFPGRRHAQEVFTTVHRATGADVIGPILCGFARPLSPMPRDVSLPDLVSLIGITALQSTWS